MDNISVTRILASLILGMAMITMLFAPATALAYDSGWQGEYFDNRYLGGNAVVTRSDEKINFNWGEGRPAPQLPVDDFSVRWTRKLDFESGIYRFTFRTDDGIRFYIDGHLVLERWFDQGVTAYEVEWPITAGRHSLMLEYYEHSGGAIVSMSWAKITAVPTDPGEGETGWLGQYYNNRYMSGAPVLTRTDPAINFNWGEGSPAAQVNRDDFSVRWARELDFESGIYRFTFRTDDGIRFYIDGYPVLERWFDQGVTGYVVERPITAGRHTLMLDYYEHSGGAIVSMSWAKITAVPTEPGEGETGWLGQYYNNRYMSGAPVLTRTDPAINFNWGEGSPAAQINRDDFSVRWARELDMEGGIYRFTFYTDDGIRFYIDGYPVLERWFDQGVTGYIVEMPVSTGRHTLMLDYYEHSGGAIVSMSWVQITPVDLLGTGR